MAFEKRISSPELLLLPDLQTQYDKKETGWTEQPIFNLLKQFQSHS